MDKPVSDMQELADYVREKRSQPYLAAFLFCDQHYQTKDGKALVIGIFDILYVREPGAESHPIGLYIRMGGLRNQDLLVRGLSEEGEVVLEAKPSLKGDGDSDEPRIVNIFSRFSIKPPSYGFYWFEVWCEDVRVGGTMLQIARTPSPLQDRDSP